MRENVNGRGVSFPIATIRAIRQMREMASYLRNQRNLAPTPEMRARYEKQLQGKLAEIRALEEGAVA